AAIQASPRGAAVLLNCGEDAAAMLGEFTAEPAERDSERRGNAQMDLRTYGVGAQILRELGISRMKLLGSPRRMPSMTGYNLEVTGFVTADSSPLSS
ncbi:MAG TPA: bifunctional 3,4-dihydroxy-2-butanone-4-phosphate synthase/GTP cyclohydrolase II, partial [Burkholderiaceae bacterium]